MTRLWQNQAFTIARADDGKFAGAGPRVFFEYRDLGVGAATPAAADRDPEPVTTPSGQDVVLSEVLLDDAAGETWVRFRFVAPRIARAGGDIGYDAAAADMVYLCETLALPYLDAYGLKPARVVISLADRAVPFGSADPGATQYFEAYRRVDSRCIWEEF